MIVDAGLSAGYIRTRKAHHGVRKLTLKHGRTFGLFDAYGDLAVEESWDLGVYHAGTRALARFEIALDGEPPLLLSSHVDRDNLTLSVDLTNPDFVSSETGTVELVRGSVFLGRKIFLVEGVLFQEFRWRSYADEPVDVPVTYRYETDFADIFEVRGLTRERRGETVAIITGPRQVEFRYAGLDGVERLCCLSFSGSPEALTEEEARFRIRLEPQQSLSQYVTVAFEDGLECQPTPTTFERRLGELRQARLKGRVEGCEIASSNERVNDAIERAGADLRMLRTETPHGPYPFAGTPWFSTVFGRDGLWTALFCNWLDPEMSKGVLGVLADAQATAASAKTEAEPGKILHEMREGEMARLGEVPFARYYGSVDATLLFAMLADAYVERTDDDVFARRIWPNVKAALGWMEHCGDADGDGFVEYHRRSEDGLVNQGWKDSHDAVFHSDGTMAKPPIALCEVQAYAYAAWLGAGRLAARLGEAGEAARLRTAAERLRERFEAAFWSETIGTYALALDGDKRRCEVVTSNVGHVLYCGLASQERAAASVRRLMEASTFSGWGVRTLSEGTARYNPMSYHNGSVWPHDSAIVAAGFARYGFKAEAAQLTAGLMEACEQMDLARLPELFCGFPREPGAAPTLYPVACSPQAWASAAIYSLLQSCFGLRIEAKAGRVVLANPTLPAVLDRILIQKLEIGGHHVDLSLERRHQGVTVDVLRRTGDVEVVVEM